ncbi:hypothetical protein HDA32_005983 [Spinactinospora alkalitolerans]|uniref:Uncharacterized protein n=1 Tax=Spinactinospora alkalitolerans TaxID=687207 RepID=A0A852U7K8_9ACTN|nr:hypothetical protein [Spinactinospora alkalitolerans]NYE50863.1 hypothetical protein [Spinactinospora alkalitolerans]
MSTTSRRAPGRASILADRAVPNGPGRVRVRPWEEWLADSGVGEADRTDEPGVPGSPHGADA